jgi:serine protease Do
MRDLKDLQHCGKTLMPCCLIVALTLGSFSPTTLLSAEPTTADPVAAANALSQAFRNAAEKATPSVVVVRSETKARNVTSKGGQNRGDNPFRGTPFEDFFRDGMPEGFNVPNGRAPSRSGVGSGVIVDAAGIVLTNNHVVEGADEVTIELSDGREFKAVDIKTDPDSDLAVVRLADAQDLPTAALGNSDELVIGDWVLAIGNPFELETTVSAGIISAKGRELGRIRRAKFLQTDAAINPGNSGGPLVNLSGEVVGINTAIASNSGAYQGIGFAIPINQARWVSEQLIQRGSVERGYLGVSISQLSSDMAAKLGSPGQKGVLVTEVMSDTPAAVAGMQDLDIILSFDGTTVDSPRSLQEVVERSSIGEAHDVVVLRDGKEVTVRVQVKALPEQFGMQQRGRGIAPGGEETFYSQPFGIEVRDKSTVAQDTYEGFEGVLVDRVDPDSLAAEGGLVPGVLIRKVGKTPVSSIDQFEAAIEGETPEGGIVLQIRTPRGNAVILLKKEV